MSKIFRQPMQMPDFLIKNRLGDQKKPDEKDVEKDTSNVKTPGIITSLTYVPAKHDFTKIVEDNTSKKPVAGDEGADGTNPAQGAEGTEDTEGTGDVAAGRRAGVGDEEDGIKEEIDKYPDGTIKRKVTTIRQGGIVISEVTEEFDSSGALVKKVEKRFSETDGSMTYHKEEEWGKFSHPSNFSAIVGEYPYSECSYQCKIFKPGTNDVTQYNAKSYYPDGVLKFDFEINYDSDTKKVTDKTVKMYNKLGMQCGIGSITVDPETNNEIVHSKVRIYEYDSCPFYYTYDYDNLTFKEVAFYENNIMAFEISAKLKDKSSLNDKYLGSYYVYDTAYRQDALYYISNFTVNLTAGIPALYGGQLEMKIYDENSNLETILKVASTDFGLETNAYDKNNNLKYTRQYYENPLVPGSVDYIIDITPNGEKSFNNGSFTFAYTKEYRQFIINHATGSITQNDLITLKNQFDNLEFDVGDYNIKYNVVESNGAVFVILSLHDKVNGRTYYEGNETPFILQGSFAEDFIDFRDNVKGRGVEEIEDTKVWNELLGIMNKHNVQNLSNDPYVIEFKIGDDTYTYTLKADKDRNGNLVDLEGATDVQRDSDNNVISYVKDGVTYQYIEGHWYELVSTDSNGNKTYKTVLSNFEDGKPAAEEEIVVDKNGVTTKKTTTVYDSDCSTTVTTETTDSNNKPKIVTVSKDKEGNIYYEAVVEYDKDGNKVKTETKYENKKKVSEEVTVEGQRNGRPYTISSKSTTYSYNDDGSYSTNTFCRDEGGIFDVISAEYDKDGKLVSNTLTEFIKTLTNTVLSDENFAILGRHLRALEIKNTSTDPNAIEFTLNGKTYKYTKAAVSGEETTPTPPADDPSADTAKSAVLDKYCAGAAAPATPLLSAYYDAMGQAKADEVGALLKALYERGETSALNTLKTDYGFQMSATANSDGGYYVTMTYGGQTAGVHLSAAAGSTEYLLIRYGIISSEYSELLTAVSDSLVPYDENTKKGVRESRKEGYIKKVYDAIKNKDMQALFNLINDKDHYNMQAVSGIQAVGSYTVTIKIGNKTFTVSGFPVTPENTTLIEGLKTPDDGNGNPPPSENNIAAILAKEYSDPAHNGEKVSLEAKIKEVFTHQVRGNTVATGDQAIDMIKMYYEKCKAAGISDDKFEEIIKEVFFPTKNRVGVDITKGIGNGYSGLCTRDLEAFMVELAEKENKPQILNFTADEIKTIGKAYSVELSDADIKALSDAGYMIKNADGSYKLNKEAAMYISSEYGRISGFSGLFQQFTKRSLLPGEQNYSDYFIQVGSEPNKFYILDYNKIKELDIMNPETVESTGWDLFRRAGMTLNKGLTEVFPIILQNKDTLKKLDLNVVSNVMWALYGLSGHGGGIQSGINTALEYAKSYINRLSPEKFSLSAKIDNGKLVFTLKTPAGDINITYEGEVNDALKAELKTLFNITV